MKKNNSFMLVLATFLLFISVSCNKDAHEQVTATISFIEPTQGDTVAFNQELHAEGTITGSSELHGYSMSMTNLTSNEEVLSLSSYNHATAYAFHEHWVNNVVDTAVIRIKVHVVLDHEGNTTTKTIDVVALPN
jgi:hypothetical protein